MEEGVSEVEEVIPEGEVLDEGEEGISEGEEVIQEEEVLEEGEEVIPEGGEVIPEVEVLEEGVEVISEGEEVTLEGEGEISEGEEEAKVEREITGMLWIIPKLCTDFSTLFEGIFLTPSISYFRQLIYQFIIHYFLC